MPSSWPACRGPMNCVPFACRMPRMRQSATCCGRGTTPSAHSAMPATGSRHDSATGARSIEVHCRVDPGGPRTARGAASRASTLGLDFHAMNESTRFRLDKAYGPRLTLQIVISFVDRYLCFFVSQTQSISHARHPSSAPCTGLAADRGQRLGGHITDASQDRCCPCAGQRHGQARRAHPDHRRLVAATGQAEWRDEPRSRDIGQGTDTPSKLGCLCDRSVEPARSRGCRTAR